MLEIMRTESKDEPMSNTFAWQRSYWEAMLELDPSKMPAKLKRVASELQERAKELMIARDAASITESQAIVDALNNLRAIERQELRAGFESLQNAGQQGGL